MPAFNEERRMAEVCFKIMSTGTKIFSPVRRIARTADRDKL